MNEHAATMVEIFSSIQGEGLLVGLRQIFLRFHGCNLACSYCDTPAAINNEVPEYCAIEKTPGRADFFTISNPVPLERILATIENWQKGWPGTHHSISLTGGEPLLHLETLKNWLPHLRQIVPVYLETNGTLYEPLRETINHIDFVGMDFKLPSSTGHSGLWEQHRIFLTVAAVKNVFVKIVVDDETQDWEIIKTCEIISSVGKNIPLILQPKTTVNEKIGINPIRAMEFQEIAGNFLIETRIIPQTHVFAGYL